MTLIFTARSATLRFTGPTPLRNAFDVQHENAFAANTHAGAALHDREFFSLMDHWATLNGIRRSERSFTLEALARGMSHGGRWGGAYQFPGCDDPMYFRRGRVTAAVVVRPYPDKDFEDLKVYAAANGLAAHVPPNPKASFWFPGFGHLVVLTAPKFGAVKWLPDQRTFGGQ